MSILYVPKHANKVKHSNIVIICVVFLNIFLSGTRDLPDAKMQLTHHAQKKILEVLGYIEIQNAY